MGIRAMAKLLAIVVVILSIHLKLMEDDKLLLEPPGSTTKLSAKQIRESNWGESQKTPLAVFSRWNENLLAPQGDIPLAEQSKDVAFVESQKQWWTKPLAMTGIALTITMTAYILFILRRKRQLQNTQNQSLQDEAFAKDSLWACSNNPKLRIKAHDLPQELARIRKLESPAKATGYRDIK